MRYDPETLHRGLELIETHGLTDVHRLLVNLVGPGREVLEVGCASGYVSQELSARGCQVDGLEVDPVLAEKAKAHCRKVIVGDVERPEVQAHIGGPYDVILLADVVEHLQYPVDFVRLLLPHLKKDGRAIIAVPNIAHYSMRLHLFCGRFDYTDFGILDRTHLRFFTWNTFQEFLKECGLVPERMLVSEVKPPGLRFWRKFCPSWLSPEGLLAQRWPNLVGAHITAVAKIKN